MTVPSSHLNPPQREAVLQIEGPLLVVAGAGSGKTRVIVHRIAHIISSGAARPDEVLAVTFTNKAAGEMRTRVEALVGARCESIWLSTFHSLCARLLRREAQVIGLPREFVIYDTTDQLSAVKQVMRDLRLEDGILQPRSVLSRVSHAKNRMEKPEEAFGSSFYPGLDDIRRVYAGYERALREAGALDFDDLLLRAVELFGIPEVAARYGQRFKYILVDEYQDTNRPQYVLIRRLASVHDNICVVGDPDQSIYKWRGADIRNILDFEQDFPRARVIRLEQNYRSTRIILDAASAVIANNTDRKPKRLWTDRPGGEKIVVHVAEDELQEAAYIASFARRMLRQGPDESVAVLYRTNAQSRVIEDAFRREGVAYRIVGSVRFYERKEIKDALAYMKLMLNPNDDVSMRRVMNVPARGIGKGVMDALEAVPAGRSDLLAGAEEARPASLWTKLTRGLDERLFPQRAAASLAAFRDLILNLADLARNEDLSTAIARMLDRTGYLGQLREERTEESEARAENLAELVSAAREFEARTNEATLAAFVDQLSLLSDVDEEQGSGDARAVLMTLHSAKGLEFPTVVIAGLEEKLFPHSLAMDEGDVEEERRLCYVGMTRARSRLILTCASRRRVFGEYHNSQPSRFLFELPQELVETSMEEQGRPYGERRHYEASLPLAGGGGGRRRQDRPPERGEPVGPRYVFDAGDRSTLGLSPGQRVRHPQFGLGMVLSFEQLDDDAKLVVRFDTVGRKTLRARYARLEPA
ncbi:MAG: ATP-dependent helicase [Vicinamibacterales bacterium]